MSLKSFGAKIFAKHVRNKIDKWASQPEATQKKVFQELADQKISSVLVEGGPTLLSTLLKNKLYDRLTQYCCPLLLGEGRSFFKDQLDSMKSAQRLKLGSVKKIGTQVRMDFEPKA
jgi:riboflavin biosynthesis pyrimidine reductase